MTDLGSGRYRLDQRIASGGMGEVWRGTDTSLGRRVAIKLLHHSLSDDETFRARFEAEAQHAASLHDPRIATVFDYGDQVDESDAHRSYLVMEYVDGQPLSRLLRGPISPEHAAHLLAQAADGLSVAHEAGIVHRDVKPANFLVTPDRRLKITDFGVARAKGASSLTDTGTVIGTPAYVAPEVAEGREATPLSDVYSLGVVLYECLAGRRPFTADTPVAVAIAHLRDEPPSLPESVPAPLRDLTTRALSKDPAQRPISAAAFAAELRGFVTESPAPAATRAMAVPIPVPAAGAAAPRATSVQPAATTAPAGPPSRRGHSMVVPLLAVAAAIVLIVAAAVALSATRDDDPDTATQSQPTRITGEETRTTTPSPTEPSETMGPSENTGSSETTAPSKEQPPAESAAEEETVQVDPDDYIGDDANDAEKALRALGLTTTKQDVESDDGERNTVADLEPTGAVPLDAEITLYVWNEKGPGNQGPGDDDDD